MIIFVLIEVGLLLLAAWFIITQLLVPAIRGTVVLPMFRPERKLRATTYEQRQTAIEYALERAIAERDAELNPPAPAEDSIVVPPKENV